MRVSAAPWCTQARHADPLHDERCHLQCTSLSHSSRFLLVCWCALSFVLRSSQDLGSLLGRSLHQSVHADPLLPRPRAPRAVHRPRDQSPRDRLRCDAASVGHLRRLAHAFLLLAWRLRLLVGLAYDARRACALLGDRQRHDDGVAMESVSLADGGATRNDHTRMSDTHTRARGDPNQRRTRTHHSHIHYSNPRGRADKHMCLQRRHSLTHTHIQHTSPFFYASLLASPRLRRFLLYTILHSSFRCCYHFPSALS
jgi:hypothetical protein